MQPSRLSRDPHSRTVAFSFAQASRQWSWLQGRGRAASFKRSTRPHGRWHRRLCTQRLQGTLVPAASPHQKLAWELVRFLTEHSTAYLKLGRYTGLRATNDTATARHIKFWENVFVPALEHGHYLPMLVNGLQVAQAIQKAEDAIILNDANVKTTLAQAYATIKPLLNR